jgi:hypothetical protein
MFRPMTYRNSAKFPGSVFRGALQSLGTGQHMKGFTQRLQCLRLEIQPTKLISFPLSFYSLGGDWSLPELAYAVMWDWTRTQISGRLYLLRDSREALVSCSRPDVVFRREVGNRPTWVCLPRHSCTCVDSGYLSAGQMKFLPENLFIYTLHFSLLLQLEIPITFYNSKT